MLSIGQYVTDAHTGKTVKIIGAQQVFGLTTYQVYDPDMGEIYNAAEKGLVSQGSLAQPSAAFVRFASVYRQFTDVSSFMDELNKLVKENKAKD